MIAYERQSGFDHSGERSVRDERAKAAGGQTGKGF
jgi:hypothetical protein